MKVCGFTFIKNAVQYDYPVTESIRSVLPLVDEMVVVAGDSSDTTNQLIESIGDPKIRLVHSVWDNNLRSGGTVLAVETNKAMDAAHGSNADWLFYIQGDEVLHEKYLPVVQEAMERYREDPQVEGLLFRYLHFYGSYRYIGNGRKWYSREIRVIRNNPEIRSYRDAQGFRKANGRKLKVKLIDACIYHYGWVRNPVFMQKKIRDFAQYWNDDTGFTNWAEHVDQQGTKFDYSQIDSLELFEGTHPAVMKKRIDAADWDFRFDIRKKNFKNSKHRLLYYLDKKWGIRPFEYRNYKLI